MKRLIVGIGATAVFVAVGCRAQSSEQSAAPAATSATSTQSPVSSLVDSPTGEHSAEPVTVESALDAIGADCPKPLAFETNCTYKGIKFQVGVFSPAEWDMYTSARKQACDQGYINPGYVILTDGATWALAADNYNEDTRAIGNALQENGLAFDVKSYCPTS